MSVSKRLQELGITLPQLAPAAGSYVPAVRWSNCVVTSGQLPFVQGQLKATGKVPTDVTVPQAQQAAQIAVLNALAAVVGVVGSVDHIERILRLGVFVNSSPGFTEQPKVANGASDLLVQIWGENGRHARAAVGAAELPLNAAVEVELMVLVRS